MNPSTKHFQKHVKSLMKFVKKTKSLSFSFITLLLLGCGIDPLKNKWTTSNEIEPEFLSYVEEFKLKTGLQHSVKMSFGDIEKEDVIAYCYNYSNLKKNYIVVDRTNYNELSDLEKEETIFHELGHCILFRNHDETILKATETRLKYNLYKSIMYPYVFGGVKYQKHKTYYQTELNDPNTKIGDYL